MIGQVSQWSLSAVYGFPLKASKVCFQLFTTLIQFDILVWLKRWGCKFRKDREILSLVVPYAFLLWSTEKE